MTLSQGLVSFCDVIYFLYTKENFFLAGLSEESYQCVIPEKGVEMEEERFNQTVNEIEELQKSTSKQ